MECFAASSDGFLLATNGIDPVLRWDGNTPQMEEAGLDAPLTPITMTGDTTGEISGTYYAYSRFVDKYGNYSNLSPLSEAVIFDSIANVNYSGVPVPTSDKVRRRQILRNTAGQTSVFYVDIDTDDLTTTSFTSTKIDTVLAALDAVALFDTTGMPIANNNGKPPSDKSVVAAHLDRMFMTGEEIYHDGSVKVVFGSKTVTGIQTEWPSTLAGRFLWVAGADRSYEIDSVDVANQTLALLEEYQTSSIPYASYGIRPPVAQRRLVQFSEAGLPESWPATYALSIQEDGDELVGLMPMGSFLYMLERQHVYRLTFQEDPLKDGYVFLGCNRGCVNNRCAVVVDEAAYLLDDAGIYKFSGNRQVEHLSSPIQDLFDASRINARYKIRFEASRYFHASYDYGSQVIRWFVALAGTRYPRHALCLNLNSQAWWLEEFPVPIASSCTGILNGQRRVYLGGPSGQVYILNGVTLDMVDSARGTVRGSVTNSTFTSLSDTSATFGDDLVGSHVVIVSGTGTGQMRIIVEATATRLSLDRPWNILPTEVGESVYQIGGIKWRYRTGWFRWAPAERETPRRLEILHEPCLQEQRLDAYLYQDRSRTPVIWDNDYKPEELSKLGSTKGEPALYGDLTGELGFMQRRLDGHKDFYIDGPRLFSWELDGVTNQDQAVIYQITLDGAMGAR